MTITAPAARLQRRARRRPGDSLSVSPAPQAAGGDATSAPAISFSHVSTIFPGAITPSLSSISFDIAPGEVFGVIGTSGAGKSTLVRTINGLHVPTSGTVTVLGHDIAALDTAGLRSLRRDVAMVFQHHNLLESQTIAANIALPLVLAKTPAQEINSRVDRVLSLVGLAGRGDDYPAQLSGGQRQRVGIARALVTEPKILLCDEPTSALDPITTTQILDLVADVAETLKITVVIITHQMEVISRICHKVAVLDQGHLIEKGPVAKVFAHPGSPVTKRFVSAVIDRTPPAHIQHAIDEGTWDEVVAITSTGAHTAGLIGHIASAFSLGVDLVHATTCALRDEHVNYQILGLTGTSEQRAHARTFIDAHPGTDATTVYPAPDSKGH